jgi:hypothetical protein
MTAVCFPIRFNHTNMVPLQTGAGAGLKEAGIGIPLSDGPELPSLFPKSGFF